MRNWISNSESRRVVRPDAAYGLEAALAERLGVEGAAMLDLTEA